MKAQRLQILLAAVLSLSLFGCGSTARQVKPDEISNPYLSKTHNHMETGMHAMRGERWSLAQRSFAHALHSARLADAMPLIIQARYNLAVTYAFMGNRNQAETAYLRCIQLAKRHGHRPMLMRARLGLALMRLKSGNEPNRTEIWPDSLFEQGQWPSDIQLQAARLAQRTGQAEKAAAAYQTVLHRLQQLGKNSALIPMKAQAYMGLALLARDAGQADNAWQLAEKVSLLCRRIGLPRLNAHALLLQGKLPISPGIDKQTDSRIDKLERALGIYSELADLHGQQQSLLLLQHLQKTEATSSSNDHMQYRLRLRQVNAKLGQQTDGAN